MIKRVLMTSLVICILGISVLSFSLPVYAVDGATAIYQMIYDDLPTYTHGLYGEVVCADIYALDNTAQILYVNRIFVTCYDGGEFFTFKYEYSQGSSSVTSPYLTYTYTSGSHVYRTSYLLAYQKNSLGNWVCISNTPNYFDSSSSSMGYVYGNTLSFYETNCLIHFSYANLTNSSLPTFSIGSSADIRNDLGASPLGLSFAGDEIGPRGHNFAWSQYQYIDVVEYVEDSGNYGNSRIYFYFNSNYTDSYYYVKTNGNYAEYNFFSKNSGSSNYFGEYFYSKDGEISTGIINSTRSMTWTYDSYYKYSDLLLVYQSCTWKFSDGYILELNDDSQQIVDGVVGGINDKLDDIYNEEHPWDAPDIETGDIDDMDNLQDDILADNQVDTSILEDAMNFDKSAIPLVGQMMTSVIDLGFGSIVIFCLSMGLGLSVLGKRFG